MKRMLIFLGLLGGLPGALLAGERVLVCLGDSLTAGYGLSEDKAYPALLPASLPGWTVVNAGVSGDTTAGGLKRLDWALRSQPDAVLVALGANDGLRAVPVEATEANLRAILQKIKASGAKAYLAGMDLPTNLGDAYRDQFKAVFKRVAKAEKVETLNFLLAGVGGHPELNQSDGMHPTEAGQVIVAATVTAFLKPKLAALPPRRRAEGTGATKILRRRQKLSQGEDH